jgi:hypothetical protein
MYVFAILGLLGLGTAAAVTFLDKLFAWLRIREFWTLAGVAAGIGVVWLADFDMWASWGIPVRSRSVGVLLTGLAVGGVAYLFHEVLGLFMGMHRRYDDQAEVIERTKIRRAA